jgi:hypothetical protein
MTLPCSRLLPPPAPPPLLFLSPLPHPRPSATRTSPSPHSPPSPPRAPLSVPHRPSLVATSADQGARAHQEREREREERQTPPAFVSPISRTGGREQQQQRKQQPWAEEVTATARAATTTSRVRFPRRARRQTESSVLFANHRPRPRPRSARARRCAPLLQGARDPRAREDPSVGTRAPDRPLRIDPWGAQRRSVVGVGRRRRRRRRRRRDRPSPPQNAKNKKQLLRAFPSRVPAHLPTNP